MSQDYQAPGIEVAKVAEQISSEGSTNRNMPSMLLKLKKLVDSVSPLSDQIDNIMHDIWQLKLLDVIAVVLKMDFTGIPPDSWTTAASLVTLAVQCFKHPQGKEEFQRNPKQSDVLIHLLTESILECARNCSTRYCGLANESLAPAGAAEKLYCLRALKEILAQVTLLLEHYPSMAGAVLRSANLSQILVSEVNDVSMLAVNLVGKLYAEPATVPSDFDGQDLVEECLFKMATTESIQTARECVKTLSNIINCNPRFANIINSKFAAVKEMIYENWTQRLMLREEDLKDFYHLIDARDAVKQTKRAMNPKLRAVLTIQAFVKSYQTRKKLKQANEAFAKVQQKWRERKKREVEEKYKREMEERARFQMFLAKKNRVRHSRQTLLKQMLSTPPEHFPSFLRNLEQSAAARIQAAWKGHQARKRYDVESEQERRDRAACQIQQSYRRYRTRCRKQTEQAMAFRKQAMFQIPELTPERRAELERDIQHRIIDFRTRNPNVAWSRERLGALHERGQDALANYYNHVLDNRRVMHDCETTMARIEIDFATMRESCPKLESATMGDAARLSCPSKPIRSRALTEHRRTMELLSGPWWARFAVETEREEEEYRKLIAETGHNPNLPSSLMLVAERDVPPDVSTEN